MPTIAIISANAFDKGLENDVGVAAEDFILKPLKVEELLAWIGHTLALEWVTAEPTADLPPAPAPAPRPLVYPPEAALAPLDEAIALGYLRGILNQLGAIEQQAPEYGEFVRVLRDLARQFQFDAMQEILRKGRHATS